MPANFPLGVANDDRVAFSDTSQIWERGTAGGGGCPPIFAESANGLEVTTGASVVRSFGASQLDNPTYAIRTDPTDVPVGSLAINSVVTGTDSGAALATVTVDFDSSSASNGDRFYLEIINANGCSVLVPVSVSAG